MTTEKYRVFIPCSAPQYWLNFITHCHANLVGNPYDYRELDPFINQQLKPYGKFIRTRCQSDYLRWDDPKYHTAFVLRWA
jgi:hypothetical protein